MRDEARTGERTASITRPRTNVDGDQNVGNILSEAFENIRAEDDSYILWE